MRMDDRKYFCRRRNPRRIESQAKSQTLAESEGQSFFLCLRRWYVLHQAAAFFSLQITILVVNFHSIFNKSIKASHTACRYILMATPLHCREVENNNWEPISLHFFFAETTNNFAQCCVNSPRIFKQLVLNNLKKKRVKKCYSC